MAFYLAVFDLAVLWSELCNEATFQQAGTGQDANVARDSHMPCTTHRQNPESYDDTERFLFWQISDLTQFLNANSYLILGMDDVIKYTVPSSQREFCHANQSTCLLELKQF